LCADARLGVAVNLMMEFLSVKYMTRRRLVFLPTLTLCKSAAQLKVFTTLLLAKLTVHSAICQNKMLEFELCIDNLALL